MEINMQRRQCLGLFVMVLSGCAVQPPPDTTSFSLVIVPAQFAPAVPGQECMILVGVEESSAPAASGDPVQLSVAADHCAVSINPSAIRAGDVAEVTLVPEENALEQTVIASIRGQRGTHADTATASFEVWHGEDTVEGEAIALRDRFVAWLADAHPELEITGSTEWESRVVRPVWLVVTHYLFLSDEWEMGVSWHIMIPPSDWTRIYLRHRFDEMTPSLAFEISSRANATEPPHEIEPPDEVTR